MIDDELMQLHPLGFDGWIAPQDDYPPAEGYLLPQAAAQPDLLPVQTAIPSVPGIPSFSREALDQIPISSAGPIAGIPSGLPTPQQLSQARTHQNIGNATAQTQAGFANLMNVFKPGSGSDFSAKLSQEQGNQLAQQALGQGVAQRKEAIENLNLRDAATERELKASQQKQTMQNMLDDQSPHSKRSQDSQQAHRERYNQLAAFDPANAQVYQNMGMLSEGKSRAQLEDMEKTLGAKDLLKMKSEERQAGSKRELEAQKAAQEKSYQTGELAVRNRLADIAGNKEVKAQVNEDKKVEEELTTLRSFGDTIGQELQKIDSGKLNTDRPHTMMNEVRKEASNWPGVKKLFDKPDEELQRLKTTLPLSMGAVEGSITGSKRYTPERWRELTPQPGDSTDVVRQKLSDARDFVKGYTEEKIGQLHQTPNGSAASSSGLAKALPPGAIGDVSKAVQAKTKLGELETPQAAAPPATASHQFTDAEVLELKRRAAAGSKGATSLLKKAGY